ncbi:hypothetical protein E5676_scaffold2119G00320 [Cucumis melo var. makuwa]|uniref:Uncharacterized protein n=1 Tax=Cucumis melo var. makuwa TaxID=1194695 RepID=A0A5D3BYN0_CUCMM|nr:hypothetical protein E6C27_scaffold979G00830 [Cucumis melo var. makuwa]TYK04094.1 hypothetical protein E5676_scaffold2119G00320 [Cucumis melo var. makuwa]
MRGDERESAHKSCMMMEKRKREEEEKRRKVKGREQDDRFCQVFKEKKKNVESLAETKTKMAEIQTDKKKKQTMLVDLSEQVESVTMRNKVVAHQEVDRLDVVAVEFSQKIERMSPLELRLRPKERGLVSATQPKKDKNKVVTSKLEDVKKGSKMRA